MKIFKEKKYLIPLLIFICIVGVVFFVTSRKAPDPDDRVVAKVGDIEITVRDLKLNYEFGLSVLKTGNTLSERRLSYLNMMISEKIIAEEGYNLGYDNSPQVKSQYQKLNDELHIEALIDEVAGKNIIVTDDEIRQAVNKSKVSFKFRFWVEPTYLRAEHAAMEMSKTGYNDFVKKVIKNNPEFKINPSLFETDYVTWTDISEETLAAISNLQMGEISRPVLINKAYFIFQVLDVKRSAITENDYLSQGPTVKKVLYNKKLKSGVTNFVGDVMTPKQLTTKGRAFNMLANASLEWKNDSLLSRTSFRNALNNADWDKRALCSLKQILADTMVRYSGGYLTVNQFLDLFDPADLSAKGKSEYDYKSELNNKIALTMRDYFLIKEAAARSISLNSLQQKELKNWKDKWVYQEARDKYLNSVKVSEDEIEKYFLKNKTRYLNVKNEDADYKKYYNQVKRDAYLAKANSLLTQKIDSLKKHYNVTINYDVLNSVELTESKKSRWMTFQLFKGGTNRMVVPIVDAAWKM